MTLCDDDDDDATDNGHSCPKDIKSIHRSFLFSIAGSHKGCYTGNLVCL